MRNKLLFTFFILVFGICTYTTQRLQGQELKPYTDFLENQTATAKDYILNLFRKYDLVIICERDHREITQYDLFLSVLQDPYFIDSVGNVFTEVGVSTLNPRLNWFVHNDSMPEDEVQRELLYFQRNVTFWPLWEKYNYYYFIKGCYEINRNLPPEKKINLFPSDVPFKWSSINDVEDLKAFWKKYMIDNHKMLRDSVMAAQIIHAYDSLRTRSKRKKALIIMNYNHAFNDVFDPDGYNTGRFLFQKYRGNIANVLVNNHMVNNPPYYRFQRGKWDAAFKSAGVTDVGFDFNNSPFGKDGFDYYPGKENLSYEDVFTGMVFFKPLEEFRFVSGIPGVIDRKFLKELLRRRKILHQMLPRKDYMSPGQLRRYYNNKRIIKINQ